MEKEQRQYTRRIRNLIFIFAITAILVTVSTYAWFIGMRTVNIDEFQVEVAGTESLWLSVDGKTFGPTVSIDKDSFDTYTDNTNTWGGDDGLVPRSSVGVVNEESSRLELYEKASLTPSPGGFRLIASKVENEEAQEKDGYVAFDLFIRNFTGSKYIEELREATEEAIYLTVDSGVRVSDTDGEPGMGIENSVRVAFAQIGRVIGTTDTLAVDEVGAKLVQGITCKDSTEGLSKVTGICRKAQIWEPNDVDHVSGAITYYETACRKRKDTGTDVTLSASFITELPTGNCGQVIDGLAYPTYAINSAIGYDDNVDVYDGPAYNSYAVGETSKLSHYATFTDTMKLKEGMDRPVFMTLAPNSITKVRVYVYIEGQDIDNYDFAQVGKAIKIKFGFTKQRFTEDDVKHTGPDINKGEGPKGADLTPPVIAIAGDVKVINHTLGEAFVAPVATATDNKDETVTVTLTNKVNINVAGEYTLVYKAVDTAKNVATKTVKVIVE